MQDPLIDILYTALRSPRGIIVRTSDPNKLRQRLYKERKTDPDLEVLSFNTSPFDAEGELWIIKKDAK